MLTKGSAVPDIALQDTDGRASSLADHAGTDGVLLYLMRSTSCPVCNQHVKDLVGRQEELRAAGVKVLVAIPQEPADAAAWKAKRQVPFTVVTGRRGTPHEALGLTTKLFGAMQQSGSVLIDRGGIVRHAHGATMPVASYDKKGIAEALGTLTTGARAVRPAGGSGPARAGWPTDRLVVAARNGDSAALSLLVTASHPHVRRFARSLCSSPQDAEDATQEALIVLYRQIGTLRATAALSSWMFRIVRNECLRHVRLTRRPTVAPLGRSPSAEDTLFTRLETRRLVDAITALPAEQRAVLVLRDVQGLSGAATAEALGLSRAAMKSRLHRARQTVRAHLEATEEPSPGRTEGLGAPSAPRTARSGGCERGAVGALAGGDAEHPPVLAAEL